jgi:hypothetical protein
VILVLYAVVALISAIVAVWQIWGYLNQPKGQEISHISLIIGIVCALIAIACGGYFLSSRVNKTEEIHITE